MTIEQTIEFDAAKMLREMAENFQAKMANHCHDCEDVLNVLMYCDNCETYSEGVLSEDNRELVELAFLTADQNPISETAVSLARRLR